MNCAKSGHVQYTSDWVTIDTRVKHRQWHYNGVQFDFQGTFRKHNPNKADGTLEETLKGINLGRGPETCDGGPRVFHAHAVPIN